MTKMQVFDIRRTETGEHEVIQANPLVLGTFDDYDNARLFLDALMKTPDPTPREPAPVKPAATPEPKARPEPAETVLEKPSQTDPAPVPAARKVKPQLPAISEPDPGEVFWTTALDRLAAGEKIKDVAENIGVTFGKLRSKWAGAIRAGTHQKPGADSPVSGGVGEVLKRGGPAKLSPEAFERDVAKLMGEPPLDDCQQSPAGRASQGDTRT